jgi:hypothetical protein
MSQTSQGAMRWWRTGLARLGVRTPTGRDTVVAAALAAAGLSRIVLVLVLTKLGCRDRIQAVIYAYEHGFVEPGE